MANAIVVENGKTPSWETVEKSKWRRRYHPSFFSLLFSSLSLPNCFLALPVSFSLRSMCWILGIHQINKERQKKTTSESDLKIQWISLRNGSGCGDNDISTDARNILLHHWVRLGQVFWSLKTPKLNIFPMIPLSAIFYMRFLLIINKFLFYWNITFRNSISPVQPNPCSFISLSLHQRTLPCTIQTNFNSYFSHWNII